MFKLYVMQCPLRGCGHTEEMYVEFNSEEGIITEEVFCECCYTLMKPGLSDPAYGKHGSWSEWRMGHGGS